VPANYAALKHVLEGLAASRPLWQNHANPRDINGDGQVNANDCYACLDEINSRQLIDAHGRLGLPLPQSSLPKVDVNGDGFLAPRDALIVINYVNHPPASGEGEASPEQSTPPQISGELLALSRVQRTSAPESTLRSTAALLPTNRTPSSLPLLVSVQDSSKTARDPLSQ